MPDPRIPGAPCRRAAGVGVAELFARFLLATAEGQPVRAVEAVAAVVVNQVRTEAAAAEPGGNAGLDEAAKDAARDRRFRRRLLALGAAEAARPDVASRGYASSLRIARRALAGALHDPTGGATSFRPLGEPPGDDHVPLALIGGFMFYREETGPECRPG